MIKAPGNAGRITESAPDRDRLLERRLRHRILRLVQRQLADSCQQRGLMLNFSRCGFNRKQLIQPCAPLRPVPADEPEPRQRDAESPSTVRMTLVDQEA